MRLSNLLNISNVFYILFIFIPIAIILDVFYSIDNTILFILSVLGLIPLAKLVGDTTEHLAEHYGNTGGSLINITFSNTPEIILSIVAMQAGLFDLVRANIVGSILGQLLLVFGLSLIVGGLRFKEQIFNSKNIRFHITLLLMSIAVLSTPTILILGNLTFPENHSTY
jgi:Ca2+:H+ antiporter